MVEARITVNGKEAPIAPAAPHTTVLDFLRERGLTGTKEGCAEGECGACSVLVARPGVNKPTDWVAVNACLVPVAALDGQEIVTSEGLATPGEPGTPPTLHPVQEEMAVRGGSQCGYCTPGFVCSMAAEYYRPDRCAHADPATDAEHGPNGFDLHSLSGNLCRCTGYRPIRDAAFAVGTPTDDDPLAQRREQAPPAPVATAYTQDGGTFLRTSTLAETLRLLRERPDAVVVSRLHRLGRRGQHPLPQGGVRHRRRPAARTAGTARRAGPHRDRGGADPHRDRTPPRRQRPAAGRAVPPVRLPAHPQQRDLRRQPGHRLAHR